MACSALIACGGGGDDPPSNPPPTGGTTVLTGKVQFELVPHNQNNNSLDYDATRIEPIRGAPVELLNNTGGIIASTVSSATGDYSFSVATGTQVSVRVRTQLLQTGTPSWNFTVVDNTDGNAVYAVTSTAFTTAGNTMEENVTAGSGWTGSGYGGSRVAGPFAILDTVYQSVQKVLQADANANFPELRLNWSKNNRATRNANDDFSSGEIGTSFYTQEQNSGTSVIYLLGTENADTDEYDRHVVAHEWTHYFEDRFGRSDSLGGGHGGGDLLDPRVAFGEGLGYAAAGMILDDPNVIDTLGFSQSQGFNIDVERNTVLNPGWYSESSIQAILYDLYDSAADGADNLELGFAPIFKALTEEYAANVPLTTAYSYIAELKADLPGDAASIDAIVENQSMASSNSDAYGSNETNDAGRGVDVLPVYTQLPMNGSSITLCSIGGDTDFGTFNKLGNRRFMRFDVSATANLSIVATGPAGSDPDMVLHQGVILQAAESEDDGVEALTRNFAPGNYVLELYEWSNTQDSPRGKTCFNVQANAS